ncbi:MAG: hypothetical protein KJ571_15780 [Bacteroidetes bacterium]|nr:hypothetical protein [Bacteroidota bacterium]
MDEFYCSNCENQVKEDDQRCAFCGANLEETIKDVDEQTLVAIKNYINYVDAEIEQQFLLQCGIESFISKDDAGGMYPHHFGGINNYRLLVLESNLDEALKVLHASESNENSLESENEAE